MSEAATKPDIVVGVDGSDESFAALKWALEEASLTGQPLLCSRQPVLTTGMPRPR